MTDKDRKTLARAVDRINQPNSLAYAGFRKARAMEPVSNHDSEQWDWLVEECVTWLRRALRDGNGAGIGYWYGRATDPRWNQR